MLSAPVRTSLPFSRYRCIHTRDFDEAAQFFSRMPTRVQLTRTSKAPFSWCANQVPVGQVAISASEYLGGASLKPEAPLNDYVMSIPQANAGAECMVGTAVTPLERGKAGMLDSPEQCTKLVMQPGYRSLNLSVPRTTLLEAWGTLTGAAPPPLVTFQCRLALDTPQFASLLELLLYTVAEAESLQPCFTDPKVADRLAEALIFRLLLSQPHSHSEALSRQPPAVAPGYVRRATEYLDAHSSQPITMAELTQAAGASLRSLQLGFRKYRGCSPMDFLQERRLRRARMLLLVADPKDTVSGIARQTGFVHLGRFSVRYRERFGESPVHTLARRWVR